MLSIGSVDFWGSSHQHVAIVHIQHADGDALGLEDPGDHGAFQNHGATRGTQKCWDDVCQGTSHLEMDDTIFCQGTSHLEMDDDTIFCQGTSHLEMDDDTIFVREHPI